MSVAAHGPTSRTPAQIHHQQKTMEAVVAEERKRKNYADFWNIIPLKEPFRVILSDIRDRCVRVGGGCVFWCMGLMAHLYSYTHHPMHTYTHLHTSMYTPAYIPT